MSPRITDDDDFNLDDIETEPHAGDNQGDPPEDDQEGDDPEGDEPEGDQEEPPIAAREEEPPARRQQEPDRRRGAQRNQRLANENRDLRTQLDELRGRFDQFATDQNTGRSRAPETRGETAEQRAQRRALMSDRELIEEDMTALRAELTGSVSQTRMQAADIADKSAFDTLCASDPVYKRLAPKVEAELANLRRQNSNAPREVILDVLLGRELRAKRSDPAVRKRLEAAADRVRRQTTRPGNNSSDAGGGGRRRSASQSLEDRLANQPL